jgi:hypothetical protein
MLLYIIAAVLLAPIIYVLYFSDKVSRPTTRGTATLTLTTLGLFSYDSGSAVRWIGRQLLKANVQQ